MSLQKTRLNFNIDVNFHNLEKCSKMKYRLLKVQKQDMVVSKLGFGCSHLSKDIIFDNNLPVKGHEERIELIIYALKQGINFIDISPLYGAGRCELILGMALKNVSRYNYYLSSKVGRTHNCDFDYSYEGVLNTFFESKKRLGVDQIDILNIHDVEFASIEQILSSTLPALYYLQKKKHIKYIGLSGYNLNIIRQIIEKSHIKIDFVLSYSRFTLFDNELVNYLDFFKQQGIEIINAAPLGMGLLTDKELPKWHPADDQLKNKCLEAANYCKIHNVDLSKLALDHCFDSENVKITLVGLNDIKLLDKNLNVLINGLNSDEFKVKKKIIQQFFKKLNLTNWENIEFINYKKNPDIFLTNLRKELCK